MTTPTTRVAETEKERQYAAKARRQMGRVGLNAKSIERFLLEVVKEDLHVKTILSLALGTLGVLHATSLCIHVVGRAMAWARGADPKHCIKQFDRMLSNSNFTPWAIARSWVAFVLGERKEAWVALDWTEFDADDQATLCAYLVTRHGRATPLLWKTVHKSTLKGHRNRYESELLDELRECIPETVDVTLTADRGFGDQKRYEQIRTLGMHYVIRFRQDILLTTEFGDQKPAVEWLHPNGRARMLKQVAVTADCYIAAGDRARPRQEDEGTVVHRHLARRPHGSRCCPHLRPEIFDRGDLPGHQGHPLRNGPLRHAYRRPRPARPPPLHCGLRPRPAHTARRGGRALRTR